MVSRTFTIPFVICKLLCSYFAITLLLETKKKNSECVGECK